MRTSGIVESFDVFKNKMIDVTREAIKWYIMEYLA